MKVNFKLNGKQMSREVKPSLTLLDFLREGIGLLGTKPGCHEGECGACTVLVDKKPVNSCLYLAINIEGKEVTTIEGLTADDASLDPVQESMIANGAVQCGFCTSGMIMNIKGLQNHIETNHHVPGDNDKQHPTRDDVMKWLEGNLCRCTGYIKIIDAAEAVIKK